MEGERVADVKGLIRRVLRSHFEVYGVLYAL